MRVCVASGCLVEAQAQRNAAGRISVHSVLKLMDSGRVRMENLLKMESPGKFPTTFMQGSSDPLFFVQKQEDGAGNKDG